jgi:hypothetical protein
VNYKDRYYRTNKVLLENTEALNTKHVFFIFIKKKCTEMSHHVVIYSVNFIANFSATRTACIFPGIREKEKL